MGDGLAGMHRELYQDGLLVWRGLQGSGIWKEWYQDGWLVWRAVTGSNIFREIYQDGVLIWRSAKRDCLTCWTKRDVG